MPSELRGRSDDLLRHALVGERPAKPKNADAIARLNREIAASEERAADIAAKAEEERERHADARRDHEHKQASARREEERRAAEWKAEREKATKEADAKRAEGRRLLAAGEVPTPSGTSWGSPAPLKTDNGWKTL